MGTRVSTFETSRGLSECLISIIVPNYNSAKYINQCIDSVLCQTFKNYELIIVDDMSTDNSIELIKQYADERIKLIELTEKRYNGGTRNVGVENAKGSYICFLDCDDWLYSKDSLRDLATVIKTSNADIIRLSYVAHRDRDCRIRLRDKTLSDLVNSVFCAPWTKCVRKDKFVPFPENTLLEDVVQHIAQVDNVETLAISPTPYAVWNRANEDAISSDVAKYDESSKRYSSVYRNYADLLDLRCKHDYCEEHRQFRLRNYKDVILRDDILGLINGRDAK